MATNEKRRAQMQTLMQQVETPLEQILPTLANEYAEPFRDAVFNELLNSDHACQSPIEVIFAAWWRGIEWMQCGLFRSVRAFDLIPQANVTAVGERFRLDFQVRLSDPRRRYAAAAKAHPDLSFPLIGVELDGHDFHEKTKEQVTSRNRRDRALQQDGWRIYHISGSELHRNGFEAVQEIYMHAHDALIDIEAGIYQYER